MVHLVSIAFLCISGVYDASPLRVFWVCVYVSVDSRSYACRLGRLGLCLTRRTNLLNRTFRSYFVPWYFIGLARLTTALAGRRGCYYSFRATDDPSKHFHPLFIYADVL